MAKRYTSPQQRRDLIENMEIARRIVMGDHHRYNDVTGNYELTYPGRAWFRREVDKYRMHDVINEMLHNWYPDNWHLLLLEWPHRSESDPNRIAYTPNEKYGEADRQVITTIGKYLTRHFTDVPDHEIRDVVARHTYDGNIHITRDLDEMVDAVIEGPSSCMSKDFSITGRDDNYHHPYEVYDPAYGWGMAIRKAGNKVLGRCLVLDIDGLSKCFVRSYKRHPDERSHSGVDESIEAWLKAQGYDKYSGWPEGARLALIETRNGGIILPYIDGDNDRVSRSYDGKLFIDSNGDYEGDNTNGVADEHGTECSCCGSRCSEDDGIWVGRYGDDFVGACCSDSYTHVIGRHGDEYYVHEDDAVYAEDGNHYHADYLDDNSIVEDVDGNYQHLDDVVFIESEDVYYPADDDRICHAEDTNRYELSEDCWQCTGDGKWYTDDVDYVEVDGDKYHPDNAPETEENNDAE